MENAKSYIDDADTERFEVCIGDNLYEGLFAEARIDRSTLPEGWYAYDLREDDEVSECIEIKNGSIMVNHYGTFLTQKEIVELKEEGSSLLRNTLCDEPQEFDYSFQ